MARASFTYEGQRYFVRGKDERELGAKIEKKKKALEEGSIIVNSNTKVSVWAEEWLTTYKAVDVEVDWFKNMSNILNNIILPPLGSSRLRDIKPLHLKKILNDKSGLSASYLKKIYNIMHEMFECAKQNGLIAINPADGITLPKSKPAEKRRALTKQEREFMLLVAETHRGGIFVKIMLYCGLRPGEVAALQWKNIDFPKQIIKIDSALKQSGAIGPPKSKAGKRIVPIPKILFQNLKQIAGNPFDFVCTQQNGKLHTKTTIKLMWNNIKREMDILMGAKVVRNEIIISMLPDDLYLYNLRHTYGTDLQAAGVPINVAKELMGHSDISTTAKIYTHYSDTAFNNAADLINMFQTKDTSKAVKKN